MPSTPHGIELLALGFVFCAVLYLAVAVVAWRGKGIGARKSALIVCCFVTAAWGLAQTFFPLGGVIAAGTDLVRSISWIFFLLLSLGAQKWLWTRLGVKDEVSRAAVVLVVAIFVLGTILLSAIGYGLQTEVIFWQVGLSVLTLLLIENLLRNCPPQRKASLQKLCVAIGVPSLYDLFFYAGLLGSVEFHIGFILVRGWLQALGAPFLISALLKNEGWQSDFVPSRKIVFHSLTLAGAGTYLVTVSLAGEFLRRHGGSLGSAVEMAFLVAALVVLIGLLQSASLRARLMVVISKHFFRMRYDYRAVWLGFIRQMADSQSQRNLYEKTLRAIANAVECNWGIVWTLQHAVKAYVPMASIGESDQDVPMVPIEDKLAQFLYDTGWVVDVRQCSAEPALYSGLVLPEWLVENRKVWIVTPLIHNGVLEGFIALGAPRSGTHPLGWEDLEVLKTVGAQGASYLAEERASRELDDARRLAELNRRFAFILHDIKNVVGQMDLMVQNAEKFGDNPDFQRDMLITVRSAVERLRGMLVQLRSKSGGNGTVTVRNTDLTTLVSKTLRHWERSPVAISFAAPAMPIHVAAAEEQLGMVIDHLIQNAVDAVGGNRADGTITVSVHASDTDGVVEIIDNGPGMTQEFIRDQLFRPFETSKPNGSGLGAYQSLKMVRDMGGRLDVNSRLHEGTKMRITLRRIGVEASNANEIEHAIEIGQ